MVLHAVSRRMKRCIGFDGGTDFCVCVCVCVYGVSSRDVVAGSPASSDPCFLFYRRVKWCSSLVGHIESTRYTLITQTKKSMDMSVSESIPEEE